MQCYHNKKRLIQEGSDLTLEKAINIATTNEMSKAQLENIACQNVTVNSITRRKQKPRHTPKKHPVKECQKFGYRHDNNQCYKGKKAMK